jgi:MoxR-like ATPase
LSNESDDTPTASGVRRRLDAPDRRDGEVYVMPDEVGLAVQVAVATGRPLLLRGEPGSGKSSLAAYIANQRGWRYYEHVVTSKTQARDLLWTFDSVRRLGDAQSREAHDERPHDSEYVEPGVLWWAFAPELARHRGSTQSRSQAVEPNADLNRERSPDHSVVLIDEIDKADPDLPNGLLVPLGSNEFVVTEINQVVRKSAPAAPAGGGLGRHLIIITTNEERELPQAFLRRCLIVLLEQPSAERLVEIAKAHLEYEGRCDEGDEQLVHTLAQVLIEERDNAKTQGIRAPSTAEFLDALRACTTLGITVDSDDWKQLRTLTLLKPQRPEA